MSEQPIDYDIFDEFNILETIKTKMEKEYSTANKSAFCNNIIHDPKRGDQIKNICKMLVSLYNISLMQYDKEVKLKSSKCPEFMNYLINFELTTAGCTKTEKDQFYDQVKSNYDFFNAKDVLENKMYAIDNKYISNLHILYQLYQNYDKLNEEEEDYYKKFVKNLKSQYNYALEICFHYGDFEFCKAIKKFREYYENKKKTPKEYCHGKQCPALPELILPTSILHKDELKIAKLGNRLIGSAYTPSLKGFSEMYTGKYSNLKYLIFLQYNLHMEEDNDKNNCVMMNILYEFMQYRNDYKYNRILASFIEEFIKEYYDKKKTQYQTIFSDCKDSRNTKEYCKLYKTCTEEFMEDLTMIETDASNYFKEQEKYFNNLSTLDFLILETQAMFHDFEKMSKYSPTIMSTIVAILISLFFLYKLTPLNSIFCKGKKKRKRIPLFFPERINDIKDDNTGHMKGKPKRGKIRFAYQPT